MKTIYGTVLNHKTKQVADAVVELYDENVSVMDLITGNGINPLMTTKTDGNGRYTITVLDNFRGYVVVPSQTIKNCKVEINFARTNETQIHYNVVVKTTRYDVHDIDMSGNIDLHEVVVWLRDMEEGKNKLEYKVSQLESKFRMLVEIIIPMILKK